MIDEIRSDTKVLLYEEKNNRAHTVLEHNPHVSQEDALACIRHMFIVYLIYI